MRPAMKITVLGCHGSDAAIGHGYTRQPCRSVGLLVNDSLMIDAGTGASQLTLEEQLRIQYVVCSHLHFDHVKSLPALADNLVNQDGHSLTVASIPSVLDGLQRFIFNDSVFPNFFALPDHRRPLLMAHPLRVGEETWLGEVGITPIEVNHTVPTVGFLIRDHTVAWLYSGDTSSTEEIWIAASVTPNLKAAFIETSFPDELQSLASMSRHLTPALLAQEFHKIGQPDLPVYAYHLKPLYEEQITRQLARLDIPALKILQEGQTIVL
ncbi:MAG: 3',5'-cyclic-nucleotide phosphodiesterase [Nitrospirae bacterium]|nr:MAG: 3',5'-cyclic-nucleotide phosphodiesterase [Nitrospirota bacterium]